MKGYQADIGPGWWGKLYEEHGRALLEAKGGEEFVKKGDWNHYEIVAAGSRVRTWINGNLCVDRDDPEGARRGVIGLQLHSGGQTEVRFKNLKLTLLSVARSRPALSDVQAAGGRHNPRRSASEDDARPGLPQRRGRHGRFQQRRPAGYFGRERLVRESRPPDAQRGSPSRQP